MAAFVVPAPAQDSVTIPKARLEELERKEKELEFLKAELARARGESQQLQREKTRVETEKRELQQAKIAAEARAASLSAAAEPVIARDTPSLPSLPPLARGAMVDAMDLMNHYRADPGMAAKRYETRRIRVEGVVTAFEKPMFVSHAVIYLQTTERKWKIACRAEPPASYPVVYTAKGGDELVGSTSSGARTTLATLGQRVVIEGWCKGLRDQTVTLASCQLISVK